MMASSDERSGMPTVSVVMPVYNAELYIQEAVESILRQTFSDFELVVVDDGSSDRSLELLRSFHDSRIQLHPRDHHGLVGSLNYGIMASHGRYIARMDADDISLPRRLELQVTALSRHPEVVLVGTWFQQFGDAGSQLIRPPRGDLAIKAWLARLNAFCHGSTMFRRNVATECGLYREESFPAEDYDLWLRMSERACVLNLGIVLYRWRTSASQVTAIHQREAVRATLLAKQRAANRLISGSDELGGRLAAASPAGPAIRSLTSLCCQAVLDKEWTMARAAWRCALGRSRVLTVTSALALLRYQRVMVLLAFVASSASGRLRSWFDSLLRRLDLG
jgi:cellulose synthase/poly-beta-1,6-N-acetylglucosamine synthase-like glycosyltransferase